MQKDRKLVIIVLNVHRFSDGQRKWRTVENSVLLLPYFYFFNCTFYQNKQAENIAVCFGCCEWIHLFLLGCKLSWAQDDFVNANKVFLTEESDKCTRWEIGHLSHCQLSKKRKCFPDRNCLDWVDSCSHSSEEMKNSVTVIRSDQDKFLACNERNRSVLKLRGYFEILSTLG